MNIDRLTTSDNLLLSIQEKIKWADSMSELGKKHRKEVEDRVEEVKKSLSLKVSWMSFTMFNFLYCPLSPSFSTSIPNAKDGTTLGNDVSPYYLLILFLNYLCLLLELYVH